MPTLSRQAPYQVFGTSASGNCHKVRLALDLLGLPYCWNEIDLMQGQTRTPQFLAMNPNGQLPVLGIDAQMERHLKDAEFFVGSRLTIADLALFAYTHRADEGGFDLQRYPAVREWLARCERQPGVTSMLRGGAEPAGPARGPA